MEHTKYYNLSPEEVMKKHRRTHRTIQVISILGLFIILIFIFAIPEGKSNWSVILHILQDLGLLVIAVLIGIIARTFMFLNGANLQQILFNDCDPVKYLKVYEIMKSYAKRERAVSTVNLYKACGYYYIEEFDTMAKCLDQVNFEKIPLPSEILRLNLWGNYGLSTGHMDIYQDSLGKLLKINNGNIKKIYQDQINNVINSWKLKETIQAGDNETARKLLEYNMREEKNRLHKVLNQFYLYQIEMADQHIVEARAALEFVIEHGNTMAVRGKAQELLLVSFDKTSNDT